MSASTAAPKPGDPTFSGQPYTPGYTLTLVDRWKGIVEAEPRRKRVALVGFSSSTRGLAPVDDPTVEIWGLNQLYRYLGRFDRWFEIHNRPMFEADIVRDTDYVDWLRRCPAPIYMVDVFDDIPSSVRLDVDGIFDRLGLDVPPWVRDYWTSSPAYMVALALDLGFEEIQVYGIDLIVGTEYHYQKACMEWWLGVAAGRGVKVVLPSACALLKTTHRYGAVFEPKWGPFRMTMFEERLATLNGRRSKMIDELHTLDGAIHETEAWRDMLYVHQNGGEVKWPPS